ncbi:MAG: TraG family conjugative transposon ATPase [Puia sp.]|nr:TraG family conjugative transposon ATPase [Puia sp.]
MQAELIDKLPILEVYDNKILSKMGDITIAFEVTKQEIFTLSGEEYENYQQSFVKALKALPAGTVFHMQDIYTHDQYRADPRKAAKSFLSAASEEFFDGRPYMRHVSRIYLTRKPAGRRSVTSASSALLRGTLVPADTLNQVMIQEFEDCASQFAHILAEAAGIKLRRIGTQELVSSAKKAGIIEQYCHLSQEDDELLLRDIDFSDSIRVGDQHCLLFTLADAEHLPAMCSPRLNYERYSTDRTKFAIGFASGLGLLLPFNHIYNQYIVIEDSVEVLKRMERKRLRFQSLSKNSRENAIGHDSTNEFLNEFVSEQRVPVTAHFNVIAWTDNPAELPEIRNKVSSAMSGIDAVAHQEILGSPQIWWAGIPGNAADIPTNECFDTFLEQACCFLIAETNYRNSDSPFGLRFGDRLTGRPLHVDIDDEPRRTGLTQNGNMFILSGSGGGKSFLTNHLCRSYYEQGMHIVVVDVGHSYQVLCNSLKGYYFTYTEEDPIKFNPFFLAEGDVFDTEKKESQKSLLLSIWKNQEQGHNRSEYVALSNALQGYYEWQKLHPDVFLCFDTFYEYIRDIYAEKLTQEHVKEKEFDLENFLYVLRPYYKGGEFDFLLNATEQLDLLDQPFIVFELDAIKDSKILFGVTTAVIMDVFMSKVRKLRGVRKMIVIEEAWKAIASSGMAENIRYWVKTLRKFMGKLTLVTQEIEDIISSPVIKQAIINNSDCRILLDQSKFQNKFDFIQELLGVSEKQKAEILSINKGHDPGRVYKDCWISLGSYSKVYRLETSLEEYLTYTSDQGDKLKVEKYAKQYGSFPKGIEMLARDMRAGKV